MADTKEVLDRLARSGVVPVVAIGDSRDAVPAARALLAGGIDVMEITFRTAAAADSTRAVTAECPEMLVGAGTVLTVEQCREAIGLGARFIVSPGFDEEIVRCCLEQGIAVTPGCVTPTEITAALKLGLKVLKFFPATVYGGIKGLKALAAPFSMVKFIPTGGVSADNLADFLALPAVHAVGGTWVCSKKDIAEGNFAGITELSAQARRIVEEVRG